MNNEMKFLSYVAYLATNYLRWWDIRVLVTFKHFRKNDVIKKLRFIYFK
jgi:hypothetical protein